MRFMIQIFFAAATIMASYSMSFAAEFNDAQKTEMQKIMREYLLANPELIREMSELLQEKEKVAEAEKAMIGLKQNAETVFRLPGDIVVGNPNGKITMVEFFDYNCGWCKKSVDEVIKLTEVDKDLRIVLKEFPIFGADSLYGAKAALAAGKQGKYWEMHVAMFKHEGKITKESADEIAVAQGLDMAKYAVDIDSVEITTLINQNQALAQDLGIGGTPAFIIDEKLVPGYLPLEGLMASIAELRANGGCKLC
jgi:protein-disulfide isomerase